MLLQSKKIKRAEVVNIHEKTKMERGKSKLNKIEVFGEYPQELSQLHESENEISHQADLQTNRLSFEEEIAKKDILDSKFILR